MWTILDSILDHTQENNVCHEMAVKISGNDDIEIIFTGTSSDGSYEVCSVDSYSQEPSSHYDSYSEPSNSLLLEEEVEDRRARKYNKSKQQYPASAISRSATTATTETSSTRSMSNNCSKSATDASSKSCVYVDIDEFEEEQDRRDKERRQRRQRRERRQEDMDEHDRDGSAKNTKNQGPLQRKASEETEDSDIDDSLVFDDDFVASFDNENDEQDPGDEDLVMEVVDDDDIDDDEVLTRLIDIHVGDMMDGSSHMDKISMRLRSFDLPSMQAAPPTTNTTKSSYNAQNITISNYSISNSNRRHLLSLPQIVEHEAEEGQDGSERQARIEEIEDPHIRTLLKTISRRSKCSERFDMDALMENFRKEDVQDPTIHSALENLSSRLARKAGHQPTNSSEIEEIDLDLFFDDIRKGLTQQESRHDTATKLKLKASPKDRENAPSADLPMHISDEDIVFEHGMSSVTTGDRTYISSAALEETLIRALNTKLETSENKPNHSKFFSLNNKQKTTKTYPSKQSIHPFSTLNNKTSLGARFQIKKKLTKSSTKVSKTVGKLLSITPATPTTETSGFTSPTLCSSTNGSSNEATVPQSKFDEPVPELLSSRKSRMAQLWQKTRQGTIGRRVDTYQTLESFGERASA